MKRPIIASMIILILVAGLSATQLRAEDAHHPEKNAKGKKSTAKKLKQPEKKKPAVKTNKSNQSE
jgi:hypothetical protein